MYLNIISSGHLQHSFWKKMSLLQKHITRLLFEIIYLNFWSGTTPPYTPLPVLCLYMTPSKLFALVFMFHPPSFFQFIHFSHFSQFIHTGICPAWKPPVLSDTFPKPHCQFMLDVFAIICLWITHYFYFALVLLMCVWKFASNNEWTIVLCSDI